MSWSRSHSMAYVEVIPVLGGPIPEPAFLSKFSTPLKDLCGYMSLSISTSFKAQAVASLTQCFRATKANTSYLMQPSFTKPSGGLYLDKNTCYYDYRRSRCYSRFSICTRVPMRTSDSDASVCTLRAIRRVPATPQLLQHIPPHLHHILNQTQFVRTNDEERFSTCLRFNQQGPH